MASGAPAVGDEEVVGGAVGHREDEPGAVGAPVRVGLVHRRRSPCSGADSPEPSRRDPGDVRSAACRRAGRGGRPRSGATVADCDAVGGSTSTAAGPEPAPVQARCGESERDRRTARVNGRESFMPLHSPQWPRTSSAGRTCSTSSGADLVDRCVQREPAQLLDLAERPGVGLAGGARKTVDRTSASGSFAAGEVQSPSSTRSPASRASPISSAASRTAHSTGVSPGSSLPPGQHEPGGPALADRQQRAVPEDAHRGGDEDGHASSRRPSRVPSSGRRSARPPTARPSATRSPTRSRARPRPPRVRRPRTGPGRLRGPASRRGSPCRAGRPRGSRARCGPPGTAPAGRPGRRERPCRTCRRCRRPQGPPAPARSEPRIRASRSSPATATTSQRYQFAPASDCSRLGVNQTARSMVSRSASSVVPRNAASLRGQTRATCSWTRAESTATR